MFWTFIFLLITLLEMGTSFLQERTKKKIENQELLYSAYTESSQEPMNEQTYTEYENTYVYREPYTELANTYKSKAPPYIESNTLNIKSDSESENEFLNNNEPYTQAENDAFSSREIYRQTDNDTYTIRATHSDLEDFLVRTEPYIDMDDAKTTSGNELASLQPPYLTRIHIFQADNKTGRNPEVPHSKEHAIICDALRCDTKCKIVIGNHGCPVCVCDRDCPILSCEADCHDEYEPPSVLCKSCPCYDDDDFLTDEEDDENLPKSDDSQELRDIKPIPEGNFASRIDLDNPDGYKDRPKGRLRTFPWIGKYPRRRKLSKRQVAREPDLSSLTTDRCQPVECDPCARIDGPDGCQTCMCDDNCPTVSCTANCPLEFNPGTKQCAKCLCREMEKQIQTMHFDSPGDAKNGEQEIDSDENSEEEDEDDEEPVYDSHAARMGKPHVRVHDDPGVDEIIRALESGSPAEKDLAGMGILERNMGIPSPGIKLEQLPRSKGESRKIAFSNTGYGQRQLPSGQISNPKDTTLVLSPNDPKTYRLLAELDKQAGKNQVSHPRFSNALVSAANLAYDSPGFKSSNSRRLKGDFGGGWSSSQRHDTSGKISKGGRIVRGQSGYPSHRGQNYGYGAVKGMKIIHRPRGGARPRDDQFSDNRNQAGRKRPNGAQQNRRWGQKGDRGGMTDRQTLRRYKGPTNSRDQASFKRKGDIGPRNRRPKGSRTIPQKWPTEFGFGMPEQRNQKTGSGNRNRVIQSRQFTSSNGESVKGSQRSRIRYSKGESRSANRQAFSNRNKVGAKKKSRLPQRNRKIKGDTGQGFSQNSRGRSKKGSRKRKGKVRSRSSERSNEHRTYDDDGFIARDVEYWDPEEGDDGGHDGHDDDLHWDTLEEMDEDEEENEAQ